MSERNYRVDFNQKSPDQQRFHKVFTFTRAGSREAAVAKIKSVRPGYEVQVLKVTEVAL